MLLVVSPLTGLIGPLPQGSTRTFNYTLSFIYAFTDKLMNNKSHFDEIQHALRTAKTKQEFSRVLCVWLKMAFSMNSQQIARAIGGKASSVRRTQARFIREGIQSFKTKPTGGRKRANISIEREAQILEKFARQAKRGIVLDVRQITQAYELSVGKTVPRSTIYRLIDRHGLRRFLPRARLRQ
jgi:transposase